MTPEIDDGVAMVAVSAEVRNESTGSSSAVLRLEVLDADGAVAAAAEAPVTTVPGDLTTARQRLCVRAPHRWGPDHPYLYSCRATLREGDQVLDEESTTFGIRSLTADPVRGLRINGEPVLLRGACVHHDNGPLGAATIGRAEERRVELLKEAGFNAIRSAHNPLSTPCSRHVTASGCSFVTLQLVDEDGVLHWTRDRPVEVEVDGPGVLQALGSANPCTEEGFSGPGCTTFGGRALAIVRPTGAGRIALRATADGCRPQQVDIDARS